MTKKQKLLVFATLGIPLLLYLTFGFCFWRWDASTWASSDRFLLTFLSFIFTIGTREFININIKER